MNFHTAYCTIAVGVYVALETGTRTSSPTQKEVHLPNNGTVDDPATLDTARVGESAETSNCIDHGSRLLLFDCRCARADGSDEKHG